MCDRRQRGRAAKRYSGGARKHRSPSAYFAGLAGPSSFVEKAVILIARLVHCHVALGDLANQKRGKDRFA
eukprot:968345-Prorocentrum_lima.AAC.1